MIRYISLQEKLEPTSSHSCIVVVWVVIGAAETSVTCSQSSADIISRDGLEHKAGVE